MLEAWKHDELKLEMKLDTTVFCSYPFWSYPQAEGWRSDTGAVAFEPKAAAAATRKVNGGHHSYG